MAVGRSLVDKADKTNKANEADKVVVPWGLGAVDFPPLKQATGRGGPGAPPAHTAAPSSR